MSHRSDPILLAALKKPVLLIEGRSKRFVEEDCIMFRPDGGREIFCEKLESKRVRTDPVKTLDAQGKPTFSYSYVTVKVARRKSEPPNMAGGFSCRLPGGSKVILRFVAEGEKENNRRKVMRKILSRRRGIELRFKQNPADPKEQPREVQFRMSRQGVPHELTMQTMERSILYFPNEGRITRGVESATVVRKTEDGWEIRRRGDSAWTLVTEQEARDVLAERKATSGF